MEQNLKTPFELNGNSSELTELINTVAESKTGKALLEQAAALGYSLGLAGIDSMGLCYANEKRIVLSYRQPFEKQVSSLAHECAHAVQIENGANPYYRNDVLLKDQLIEKRLMEADAVAQSIAVCKELQAKGNAEPLAAAKIHYEAEITAFEQAGDDRNTALSAAVLKWFDRDSRKFNYEKQTLAKPLAMAAHLDNSLGKFKDMPVEQCVERICPYFTKPIAELKTPERCGMSDVMKTWVDCHANLVRNSGGNPEPSLDQIPVYKLSSSCWPRIDFPPLLPQGFAKIKEFNKNKQVQAAIQQRKQQIR